MTTNVDLRLRKLPRRLGMGADDADHGPVARSDRDAEKRLEPLFLELRHVLHARIVEQVVGNERGLVALGRPPREALAALERDAADQVLVRVPGRAQHEPVAVVLDEVDETRVHRARVREQPHDRAEHLVELEARADGGDDPREDVAAMRPRPRSTGASYGPPRRSASQIAGYAWSIRTRTPVAGSGERRGGERERDEADGRHAAPAPPLPREARGGRRRVRRHRNTIEK